MEVIMPTHPPIVAKAIEALSINVPIYRYEIKGNTVTLWLYGRTEPVKWTQPTAQRVTASRARKAKKAAKS
jgi:hypothetical protein